MHSLSLEKTFPPSAVCERADPYFKLYIIPLNIEDFSLSRTFSFVPRVSALEKFHCRNTKLNIDTVFPQSDAVAKMLYAFIQLGSPINLAATNFRTQIILALAQ